MTPRVHRVLARILLSLALIFLALGCVLFFHGTSKAHITRGIGIAEHWERADPVSLMVAGLFFVQIALLIPIVVLISAAIVKRRKGS